MRKSNHPFIRLTQGILTLSAFLLAVPSAFAAGTDTWVGNTDANWNTAANWTTVGGSTPPASGDSLVFGAAGSKGATLNNNISSLSISNLTINSGASAFTMGGNSFTIGNGGTVANNSSVNQTINTAIANNGNAGVVFTGAGSTTLGGSVLVNGTSGTKVNNGKLIITGTFEDDSGVAYIANTAANAVVQIAGGTFKSTAYTWRNLAYDVNWNVGNVSGSSGFLQMSSGSLSFGRQLALGATGGAYGAYSQSGGTALVGGFLALGLGTGSGIFNQSGGAFSLAANGGSLTGGPATIGAGAGGFGVINLSGSAAFTNAGTTGNEVWLGESGTGTLNLSGNASFTHVNSGLEVGKNSGSTGFFNLLGGVATVNSVFRGSGTGNLNFNGGTLKASAANTNFLQGLSAAYVYPNGGTIDNGGNAITIGQALLAPTGSGVSATGLSITGGSGYLDTPVVTISGGGSGATAVATVSGGAVTGITITCPGVGYTSVPAFTLTGGGGSGAGVATGTATVVANTSGGMTFKGSGTTTLSGANTYAGNTTVSGGTLLVNGSLASGSAVSVSGSGSILGGSGTIYGSTTISSSGVLTPRPSGGSATTITFGGNLTLASASANFSLSSSGVGANDKVNYGSSSTLTLDNTDTINITGTPLDAFTDYTLFTSSGGTVSLATRPTLKINGVTSDQTSAGSYQLNVSGHSLLLHYIQTGTPPVVNSASASPATLGHYQTTIITVNVTPVSGQSITSVTVTVDGLGGAADPVTLTGPGGNGAGNWTGTFTAAGTLAAGSYAVSGAVNQNDGGAAAWSATGITVTNSSPVWSGGGSDNKWSTLANWNAGSGPAPGTGDTVTFNGSIQTINNLDHSLGVASLTFNSGAGSFDITNAANTLTLAGGMTNNSANAQTLDVPVALGGAQTISAVAGNLAINGAVSDSGAGLTKAGNKSLTLSGVNTYSGATTIGGGAVTIGGAGQLGSGTYSAAITDNGAFNFGSSANQTLSGVISGTGSLTNSGSGTLTLSGGNSYGGGTTVSAGILRFGNASVFGPGTVTLNGGTIQAGGGYTLANNLTISGASVLDLAGNNTTWSGNLNGSAALTLNNSSVAATLTLNGNNGGYSGAISFNNNNAVDFISANAGSASAAWAFNDGNAGRVRIDIGNNTINFGSMAGIGQIVNNTSSTTSTLSVGALNTATIFSGTINNNGSGILALTKVGSGSLTLTGANTYSGSTTVSNGTLAISTAQTGNGSFVVNDGAVLNIFGPSGSSIAMSSLTLGAGGSSTLGLGGVGSVTALVNVASLTTHGTVAVNIASVSGIGQVPLIKYSGSIGGSGYAFVLGTLPYGVTASLVNNTANQSVDLNVTTNIYGGASKHVLFLGNSFTGYNNLYLQYSNMVVSAGYPNPQVSCYWVGSDDLTGLSGDANALAMIAQGGWDYVVLQEQSTEPCAYAQYADLMSGWMDTLDFFYDDIKSYSPNATIVLYETWAWAPGSIPSGDGTNQAQMQALLTYAYQAAATNLVNSGRTNVIVAHVGDVRLINDNYQNMNMYWDASHPNGPGTYTAGLVIFSTTYDADPLLVTYLEPNTANGSAVNATDGAYIRSLARYEAYLPQPNPPLYLQATTATDVPVLLTWNSSPIAQLFSPLGQAAGYHLKRGTASGGPYQLIGSVTGTNYTDLAVTNGVTYYYVVSATNSAGESPNSFETSIVPQFVAPPPVPAAPTNFVATASDAQVALSWSASSGATGYNVKRSTTNGGPYSIIAPNETSLTYTDTSLADGTMYFYVVSATNAVGESMNSAQVSARPVSAIPPQLNLAAGGNQLQINWPSDHTGWLLEVQANSLNTGLGTNWVTVANSSNTNQMSIPISPANGSVFYRLVYP